MSFDEEMAARLKRCQWWDDFYRVDQRPAGDDDDGGDGGDAPPTFGDKLAAVGAYPHRPGGSDPVVTARQAGGRDPEELLREAYDGETLRRDAWASGIPERGVTTSAREAARRREAGRLRAGRAAFDGETPYQRARRETRDRLAGAEREAMAADLDRARVRFEHRYGDG
jgi:hypothetical protein